MSGSVVSGEGSLPGKSGKSFSSSSGSFKYSFMGLFFKCCTTARAMISLRLWLRRACGKSRRKGAARKSAFWFCSKLNVGKNLCLNHQVAMNYSHCYPLAFFIFLIQPTYSAFNNSLCPWGCIHDL